MASRGYHCYHLWTFWRQTWSDDEGRTWEIRRCQRCGESERRIVPTRKRESNAK